MTFNVDARFYLAGHGVEHNCRLVATVVLREGTSLCLTSMEPVMELDSLWRARTMFLNLEARKEAVQNSTEPDPSREERVERSE